MGFESRRGGLVGKSGWSPEVQINRWLNPEGAGMGRGGPGEQVSRGRSLEKPSWECRYGHGYGQDKLPGRPGPQGAEMTVRQTAAEVWGTGGGPAEPQPSLLYNEEACVSGHHPKDVQQVGVHRGIEPRRSQSPWQHQGAGVGGGKPGEVHPSDCCIPVPFCPSG